MALKTNETATLFSQKKLLGKAHTSNLNLDVNEAIGSTIQTSNKLVFGEDIPTNPSLSLHSVQSSTVEYVEFALEAIAGSNYDANDPGGGAGSDSGESSQTGGNHGYAFKFKSNYESVSNNPLKGNGDFNNNKVVHETLGRVQIVPAFFSREVVNPYIIKIYKDNGSGGVGDEIPILDDIDWQVDTYNGVLFVQDFNSSKIPAHARAFIYVGNFADKGKFPNGLSGSLTQLTDGTSYLKAGNNITITSASNGSITIGTAAGGGSGNLVFNEYLGQGNGTNTLFTLDNTPTQAKNVSIYVNGLLHMPATSITSAPFQDYSVTGSNIYFASASLPDAGSIVMANYTTNDAI